MMPKASHYASRLIETMVNEKVDVKTEDVKMEIATNESEKAHFGKNATDSPDIQGISPNFSNLEKTLSSIILND